MDDETSTHGLKREPLDDETSTYGLKREPSPLSATSHLRYGSESSIASGRAFGAGGRQREDLPVERQRTLRVAMPADQFGEEGDDEAKIYIWGTRICIADVQRYKILRICLLAYPLCG